MLGKLMKYEFRASGRLFLPMWAVAVGISLLLLGGGQLVNAIAQSVSSVDVRPAVDAVTAIVAVLLVVGLSVLSVVVVIVRFYRNLIADEGYLSFTLPVTAAQHIAAKLAAGILFCLGSVVVVFLCMFIISPANSLLCCELLFEQINGLQNGWPFVLCLFAAILLGAMEAVCKLYAAMVIGSQFGQHRIIGSVVAYYLCGIAETVLLLAVALPILFPWANELSQGSAPLTSGVLHPFLFLAAGIMALVFALLLAAYFFVSRWLLSKRLNLQ